MCVPIVFLLILMEFGWMLVDFVCFPIALLLMLIDFGWVFAWPCSFFWGVLLILRDSGWVWLILVAFQICFIDFGGFWLDVGWFCLFFILCCIDCWILVGLLCVSIVFYRCLLILAGPRLILCVFQWGSIGSDWFWSGCWLILFVVQWCLIDPDRFWLGVGWFCLFFQVCFIYTCW